jgi:PAS domain S-box-containing protein
MRQVHPADSGGVIPEHPRTIGWIGTTALAMGGSNQSLFLIGALVLAQGTAAIPLLAVGLILSWLALPGWTELIMMWPKRVGGIAATCAEAFRPYSAVLANLTGVCYWWGWVPTCGLTAILSATALHHWYVPWIPIHALAALIVLAFTVVNLFGVRWATRVAVPIAFGSAALAFVSGIVPVFAGEVSWQQASTFHLASPFHGFYGGMTSAMAGLYLIGFAAPAFEAAACHVGETKDWRKNVPRAMYASAGMASVYFILLPVVWLGVIGPSGLSGDLGLTLGPTFGPLFGAGAKAAAIWFMMLNMFHGTLQPLAGAARTLSQLSEDGLLPRILAKRNRNDAPLVASGLTAVMAILFLLTDDPPWVIAAANFTYLIGICLPSIAVWLLRRNNPDMERPYRAPRFMVGAGVFAALAWFASTILGFEQFGLPTVIAGLGLAYSGAALYAWRVWQDKRGVEGPSGGLSLHVKLTGSMLLVLALDGAGYLMAIRHIPGDGPLITLLSDIFVAVALLTISVGLVLPGMIAHASGQVAAAAERLAAGTMADLTRAMQALARGDLRDAHATATVEPVVVYTRDEIGSMASSFNRMQHEAARVARALDGAREGLADAREELHQSRELYRGIVENTTSLIALVGSDGRVEYASPSIDDILGYERGGLVGVAAETLVHPEDVGSAKAIASTLHSGAPMQSATVRLRRLDGEYVDVEGSASVVRDSNGAPKTAVIVCHDIRARIASDRERDHLAEELRQSQKLEAIGKLAGGVAHDFNNILLAILGYATFLTEEVQEERHRQDAQEIVGAAQRAADLTRQLLAFGRRQHLRPQVLDLRRIVADIVPMLRRLIEADIELETIMPEDCAAVLADPNQFEQVVLNLVVNARQAMPDGGKLTLAIVDRNDTGAVELRVSDTGVGIDEETMQRIFEPFFTTKEPGEGTGLGLSTVYGVVQQSGGTVTVDSRVGQGTTFCVTLPAVAAPTTNVRRIEDVTAVPNGTERVLLVEDDDAVRRVIEQILRQRGYVVTTAAAPMEALALCDVPDAAFDLLITDVVMPQMKGTELAAQLAERLPGLPVLLVSGYSNDMTVAGEDACFLQKPFTAWQLGQKVRELLDGVSVDAAA